MTKYKFSFQSLEALVDFNKDNPFRDNCSDSAKGIDAGAYMEKWTGCTDYPAAVELARHGWPKGRDKMVQAIAAAKTLNVSGPMRSLDVAGAYPIPALAAAGEPAAMVALYDDDIKTRPIIRLGVNITASAIYGADEFTVFGAAIVSFIDGLEALGNRIELHIIVQVDAGGHSYNLDVLAKRAEEPLEIDRIAYLIAHPAFFRRIVFAHMHKAHKDDNGRDMPAGMLGDTNGHPTPLASDENMLCLAGINALAGPGSPTLTSVNACVKAIEKAVEHQLSNYGAILPEWAF